QVVIDDVPTKLQVEPLSSTLGTQENLGITCKPLDPLGALSSRQAAVVFDYLDSSSAENLAQMLLRSTIFSKDDHFLPDLPDQMQEHLRFAIGFDFLRQA